MKLHWIIPIINTEYGQGENGVRPTTPNPTSGQWSFGEKFQPGMTQILFDSVTVPYEPRAAGLKNFTGMGKISPILFHWKQAVKKEDCIFH